MTAWVIEQLASIQSGAVDHVVKALFLGLGYDLVHVFELFSDEFNALALQT